MGSPIVMHTPGMKPMDSAQLTLALVYIRQSPTFSVFYKELDGITFYIGANLGTMAMPDSRQIMWNPTQGLQVISDKGVLGVQSPALGLVHEIAHVIFGHNEAQATAFETRVALELGEPTRSDYNATGSDVKVMNSTQHTDNGIWKALEKGGGTKIGGLYDGGSYGPGMGTGFPPAPPNPPSGFHLASSFFRMDQNGNVLRDASYIVYLPNSQESVPNNFDSMIMEFSLAQEDSAPFMESPIENNDVHLVVAEIVGVPESPHY